MAFAFLKNVEDLQSYSCMVESGKETKKTRQFSCLGLPLKIYSESSLNNAEETSVDDASSVEEDDRKRPQHHLQASVPSAPSLVLHQAGSCGLDL